MAKKLSGAQTSMMKAMFAVEGLTLDGKQAQPAHRRAAKLVEMGMAILFSKEGGESTYVLSLDGIETLVAMGIIDKAASSAIAGPTEAIKEIVATTTETAAQMIERYSTHTYFEGRATPAPVEKIIIGELMKAIDTAGSGAVERWLIQQNLIDFVLPQIENRDAEIAALKARVAELEAKLVKGEDKPAPFTPMEELQAWAKGKSTYIIEILSPSEDESYIFEDLFRSRQAAALEGMRIRNEGYRGWSVFVKEKYPDVANPEEAESEESEEYADWYYEDAARTRAHYLEKAKNLRS